MLFARARITRLVPSLELVTIRNFLHMNKPFAFLAMDQRVCSVAILFGVVAGILVLIVPSQATLVAGIVNPPCAN